MATTVSVERYRKVLNDYESSDEKILQRLQYLEGFCRNISRLELEDYVKSKKRKQSTE